MICEEERVDLRIQDPQSIEELQGFSVDRTHHHTRRADKNGH